LAKSFLLCTIASHSCYFTKEKKNTLYTIVMLEAIMSQPVGASGASHLNVYTKLEGKKIPLVGNCALTFFSERR
jgi:hypothetical protein